MGTVTQTTSGCSSDPGASIGKSMSLTVEVRVVVFAVLIGVLVQTPPVSAIERPNEDAECMKYHFSGCPKSLIDSCGDYVRVSDAPGCDTGAGNEQAPVFFHQVVYGPMSDPNGVRETYAYFVADKVKRKSGFWMVNDDHDKSTAALNCGQPKGGLRFAVNSFNGRAEPDITDAGPSGWKYCTTKAKSRKSGGASSCKWKSKRNIMATCMKWSTPSVAAAQWTDVDVDDDEHEKQSSQAGHTHNLYGSFGVPPEEVTHSHGGSPKHTHVDGGESVLAAAAAAAAAVGNWLEHGHDHEVEGQNIDDQDHLAHDADLEPEAEAADRENEYTLVDDNCAGKNNKVVTFEKANELCSRQSARLCTEEELESGAAADRAAECDLPDGAFIWSRTRCREKLWSLRKKKSTAGFWGFPVKLPRKKLRECPSSSICPPINQYKVVMAQDDFHPSDGNAVAHAKCFLNGEFSKAQKGNNAQSGEKAFVACCAISRPAGIR